MNDEPHPEELEHSDTNYYVIFAALVTAFALSLGLGYLTSSPLATAMIFLIAGVKAYLVLAYFVHLSVEPRFIKVLVAGLFALLAVLYIGLVPDIVWVYGRMEGP